MKMNEAKRFCSEYIKRSERAGLIMRLINVQGALRGSLLESLRLLTFAYASMNNFPFEGNALRARTDDAPETRLARETKRRD